MRALVSVLFGAGGRHIGWVSEEDLPTLPTVGMPVVINVGPERRNPVEGQVYRSWPDEGTEPGGMLIYGGPTIPDDEFQRGIEIAGWERLADDAIRILAEAVDQTPVLAATHEVVLIVGDPNDSVQAFQRVLVPIDPILPVFGQRLRLQISHDVDPDLLDDDDGDVDLTEEQWRALHDAAVRQVEDELTGSQPVDGITEGVPSVTIYSSVVRNGVGRVAFWAPGLGNLDAAHLIANEWEELRIPAQFDPSDFRLDERVALARQTTVTFEPTELGAERIKDWSLAEPGSVDESQFTLLPPMLVEHVRAARELDNVHFYMDEWTDNQSGQ